MNLETLEDIHKPAFDRIGFQNLITDKMAFWDTGLTTGAKTFRTAGKQPSWIDYQTNYNEVYGNFAIKSSEGWMVLTRDYEPNRTTKRIKAIQTINRTTLESIPLENIDKMRDKILQTAGNTVLNISIANQSNIAPYTLS